MKKNIFKLATVGVFASLLGACAVYPDTYGNGYGTTVPYSVPTTQYYSNSPVVIERGPIVMERRIYEPRYEPRHNDYNRVNPRDERFFNPQLPPTAPRTRGWKNNNQD